MKKNDIIACPVGDRSSAHQFINNSIDNSNILLYKKYNNVSNKLNNFLENCIEY